MAKCPICKRDKCEKPVFCGDRLAARSAEGLRKAIIEVAAGKGIDAGALGDRLMVMVI